MEITESIIQKFFDGQCSATEAEAVADFLQTNPEVLDSCFQNEWVDDASVSLSPDEYQTMLNRIQPQPTITHSRLRSMRVWLAAASVILMAGIGYFLINGSGSKETAIAETAVVKVSSPQWKMKTNLTQALMNTRLEDGSLVGLQPSALIKYREFAGQTKRNIYLIGEAWFEVAKDKTKPFTVFAGGIATTAVGTKFNVQEKGNLVTVQLFEGKVKISPVADVKTWKEKELYLKPGQQFVYDQHTAVYKIGPIEKSAKENKPEKGMIADEGDSHASSDSKTTLSSVSGNWYMFNNQDLVNVFTQLEELYNVKIIYSKRDFRNVYFIGKFEKTDSLDNILNNIALLKKLSVHHKDNQYVISKKTP